uniref:Uncharacterized protein n=1 Tax=Amblyomma tuberculatum TaxID=48802 RepID=A0A6M2E3Z6_9ACAR
MHPLIVLIAFLVALCEAEDIASTSQINHPEWADEGRLGRYQDAWKSIDQNSTTLYYLAKATYENDTGSWGQRFRCLSVMETSRNETEKTVQSEFVFKNGSSQGNQTFAVNETVKAIKVYGYTQHENAIKYLVNDPALNLTDPLVFQ